jgi:hypothetical protein
MIRIVSQYSTEVKCKGIDALVEKISFVEGFNLLLSEIQGEIEVYGDDYDLLFELLKNDPCSVIKVQIQETVNGNWTLIGQCNVFLNDVEFDTDNHIAKCTLVNDTFGSTIANNADINIDFNVGTTKDGSANGAYIDESVTYVEIDGTNPTTHRPISLHNGLDYAIRFCSNNELTFYSDYLLNNPDANYYVLQSGIGLRTNTTNAPNANDKPTLLSTRNLFVDVVNLFCLIGFIETLPNGTRRLRYEPWDYWYNQPNGVTFDSFINQVVSVNKKNYFQKVQLGSAQSKFKAYLTGWVFQEDVAFSVSCNSDVVLDVSTKFLIYDPQVINDSMGGDDTYDTSSFIMHDQSYMIGVPFPYLADVVPPTPSAPYQKFYNWDLRNVNVFNKYNERFCIGVPDYRKFCDAEFECIVDTVDTLPPWTPISDPCNMADGNNPASIIYLPNYFDESNNSIYDIEYYFDLYDINPVAGSVETFALGFSTTASPISNSGFFQLQDQAGAGITMLFPNPNQPGYSAALSFDTNIGGTSVIIQGTIPNVLSGFNIVANGTIDAILFDEVLNQPYKMRAGSYIRVKNVLRNQIEAVQCKNIPYELSSNGFINQSDMIQLRQNLLKFHTINHRDSNRTGLIADVSRNLLTGQTDITLNTINV